MSDLPAPLCQFCVNRYVDDASKCRAYPDGIPDVITTSVADHRLPLTGDNGIQFMAQPGMKDEITERFGELGVIVFSRRKAGSYRWRGVLRFFLPRRHASNPERLTP